MSHGCPNVPNVQTVRETEAEAVAYVVCEHAGLAAATHCSDYIHLYCGDHETLAASLDHTQHAATEIIAGLEAPADIAETAE